MSLYHLSVFVPRNPSSLFTHRLPLGGGEAGERVYSPNFQMLHFLACNELIVLDRARDLLLTDHELNLVSRLLSRSP